MIENAEIARIFRELADLLEIEEANPFRVRAYRRAARTIETWPGRVGEIALHAPAKLTELPGVGDDLAGKIREITRTGRLRAFDQAAKRVPRALRSLLGLPGLGPRRVARLFRELGIQSRTELEEACRLGQVGELHGFGRRTVERILAALEDHRGEAIRLARPVVAQYAETLLTHMRDGPGIIAAEMAGSFRRRCDTAGDLDLVVATDSPAPVVEHFLESPGVAEVLARGPTRAAVRLRSGITVDLRVLEPSSWGAGLYYFTGSKAHNIAIRQRARRRGLNVNEYGVWRRNRRVAGATEAEVAAAIGLPLIPPELREDRGEIAAAAAGRLPELVNRDDLRGDLQSHTTASDGRDSLEAIASAARELGYEYLAITDHSPRVRVAGGLDRRGFQRQRRAIEALNRRFEGFTLLAGVEVDILPDGRLGLDDATLWEMDLVVASVHSAFTLASAEQTRRLVRALSHPAVDVLGHPTGRLLSGRPGIAFDREAVYAEAVRRGVLVEVNAQPDRLDLDDLEIRAALEAGARIAISTDAHAAAELGFIGWGVDQARRGWAEADQVANTRTLPRLRRLLHRERGESPGPGQLTGKRSGQASRGSSAPSRRRPMAWSG